MTNEEDIDGSQVFTDTSVLFDYTFDETNPAKQLFEVHDGDKVASKRVRREYTNVSERRIDVHEEMVKYAKRGELTSFEPSSESRLTDNDVKHIIEVYSKVESIEDEEEAAFRLNELVRRLRRGVEELFGDEGQVVIYVPSSIDEQLIGQLRVVIDNDADVKIICDAVEWRRDGGTGTFLTSDFDDILGERGPEEGDREPESEEQDGLPDSFTAFTNDGSEQSQPEAINDEIERRYSESATLDLLSVEEFLETLGISDEKPKTPDTRSL